MRTFGPPETLDAKLYYTGDQARALLQSFGTHETQAYKLNELFDLVFICTYTSALLLGLRKVFRGRARLWLLAFVPGFFDLIETMTILYALMHPGPWKFFDWLGLVTFLKWATSAGVLMILILGARRVHRL